MMALLYLTLMLILMFLQAQEIGTDATSEFVQSVEKMISDYEKSVDNLVTGLSESDESLEDLSTSAEKSTESMSKTVKEEVANIEKKFEDESEEVKATLKESLKKISDKIQESIGAVSEAIQEGIKTATFVITETIETITETTTGVLKSASKFVDNTLFPDKASVNGDPHFRMWGVNNDSWFPYHGECDLVLVDNPILSSGKSLKIYVRTKIKSYYSYVASVAIQIDENVLEIQGGKDEVFVNGKGTKQTPTLFAGYQIKEANTTKWCRSPEHAGSVIKKIYLGDDGKIIVVNCFGFLYVNVQARGLGFLYSTGLMGKRDKPGKFARNGTILFNNIFFAEEWQVLSTEPKLFHVNRHPQHPTQCISPPKQVQRRMGNRRRIANMACSDLSGGARKACIYDIEATGNVGMAIPYSLRG